MAPATHEVTVAPPWLDAGALVVEDAAFATDGGTVWLCVCDALREKHQVVLTQHRIPEVSRERLRGRLYIDDNLISVRSDAEDLLLRAIRNAAVRSSRVPAGNSNADDVVPPATWVIGDDIKDYLAAIKTGPEQATKHLVNELLKYVESDEYVSFARSGGR